MKTTNYELSKKLAEIGFLNIDYVFGYNKSGFWLHDAITEDKYIMYPSYYLETILGALPEKMFFGSKLIDAWKYKKDCSEMGIYHLTMFKTEIAYTDKSSGRTKFRIMKKESLADAAARLLILLHEKRLVKFGGENENN